MRIQEVDPSDPRFSGLINFFGIGIGSDTGGNRQMVMVTDGFAPDPIFTVASSLDGGGSWHSRLAVTQEGNVGIGTNAPDDALHVKSPGAGIHVEDEGGASEAEVYLSEDGDSGFKVSYSSQTNQLQFIPRVVGADQSVALMIERSNGNVGIGTTAPGAKLEVVDSIRASRAESSQQYVEISSSGADGLLIAGHTPEGNKKNLRIDNLHDGSGSPASSTDIVFRTGFEGSPDEIMRLQEDGNVGIGTNSPTVKLEVESTVLTVEAIRGRHTATNSDTAAVVGIHDVTDYWGIGVQGTGGYHGLLGTVTPTGGSIYYGVRGVVAGGSGTNYAIYGAAAGTGTNYAGYFNGDARVTGTFFKGAGGFQIDHPQDPENKYLTHSFVESPDMKNLYDGVVVLDSAGQATVQMPSWFEEVNRDFRYQLTAIGASGPNLYIAQEIQGNQFAIAGGSAGTRVSWQVTATRQDAYANAYRLPVEETKREAERGSYLHPELYDQPESSRVENWLEIKAGKDPFAVDDHSDDNIQDPEADPVHAPEPDSGELEVNEIQDLDPDSRDEVEQALGSS